MLTNSKLRDEMKKWFLLFVVLFGVSAFAQTGTKIQITYTRSVSPTAVASDIYGASGVCPASGLPASATVLGTVASPGASYDFLLGTPGTTYCFYTKAKDSAGNTSVASNTTQAVFPFPTLAPDTNVTATPK